jgi:hypothetical protein
MSMVPRSNNYARHLLPTDSPHVAFGSCSDSRPFSLPWPFRRCTVFWVECICMGVARRMNIDAMGSMRYVNPSGWFPILWRLPDICFQPPRARLASGPTLLPDPSACFDTPARRTALWTDCIYMYIFPSNPKLTRWVLQGMQRPCLENVHTTIDTAMFTKLADY